MEAEEPKILEEKPGPLPSLEQFLASRKKEKEEDEDRDESKEYMAYLKLLVARYKASGRKVPQIEADLKDAHKNLTQHFYPGGAIRGMNAAYQALCGPRPGDDLRHLTPDFLVDAHQWKHYEAPKPDEWGKFTEDWRTVHKIIVYGAKLILAVRAHMLDEGAKPSDQVLDGFVTFDQDVGLPGNKVKKAVTTIRIQMSRDSKLVSGHGYPVPFIDNTFPCVAGRLADARNEALSADNDSPRSKK